MKRFLNSIAFAMICLSFLPQKGLAVELLIPVGKVIGLELSDDTVTVAAFDEALGENAKSAGLRVGDEIMKIDGAEIDCAGDVRKALNACDGDVDLLVKRGNTQHRLQLCPRQTEEGPRLGVYLRQGIAGIGTITYYDPDTGAFGALGHGVNGPKGSLLQMKEGRAFPGQIISVKKGQCGQPGQLRGGAESDETVGILLKNTPQGVFGKTKQVWPGEPLPVAAYDEVKTGPAIIRSTVAGDTVQEYSVEILKIYPKDRCDHRNFLLKVTDPMLIATTGGIVQGMSGSPLVQDGKLIGAVTHVLVNDPTMGYGIFIENMLEAAG